tara:strand:+ start:387 stop:527 length:141 start_codon:yes stop_codon:yes gene_type:complete
MEHTKQKIIGIKDANNSILVQLSAEKETMDCLNEILKTYLVDKACF